MMNDGAAPTNVRDLTHENGAAMDGPVAWSDGPLDGWPRGECWPVGVASSAARRENAVNRSVVVALKAIVALLMGTLAAAQVWLVPMVASEAASDLPEFAWMKVPLLAVTEVALVCMQVFLVCMWVLAGRVVRDSIFETSSLGWVSALAAMPAIVGVAALTSLFFIPGPPLLGLLMLLGVAVCVGLTLLLVVMRSLLAQAAADRTDLAVVI